MAHVPDEVTPPAIATPDEFYALLLHAGFEDDGLEHIGLSKTVAHLRNYSGATELEQ